MSLGTTTAIVGGTMIAASAFQATTQIAAGRAQARSATQRGRFDAQVFEQQATMIQEQKKLQSYQANRERARVRGAVIARTAGRGFDFGGSPLAILIDNESQLLLDKAVNEYNLDVEANFARSGATRARGVAAAESRIARTYGYTNAFSTLLNAGSRIGMLNFKPIGKL